MRSNVERWKELHEAGYFRDHRCYQNRMAKPSDDLKYLDLFRIELKPEMVIAVIGSGYGRELAVFGPKVARAYGLDVSEKVHAEMRAYLKAKGVKNVVPVLAEGWAEALPDGLDLVYSVATFQHLTRDLVRDYLWGIARKLGQPGGRAVLQFAENERGTEDAEDKAYEPNVKWTAEDIALAMAGAGLEIVEIKTMTGIHRNGREWKWHWTLSRSVFTEED